MIGTISVAVARVGRFTE